MRSLQLAALGLALALAGGCAQMPAGAPSEELVVVVPHPDGTVGGVVVRRGSQETVLDKPYAASRIGAEGNLQPASFSKQQVDQTFAPALAALPGRPASFLVYFREGSDELTAESRAELDKILGELKRRPAPEVLVIGHTDAVGGAAFNDKLSLQRADRVRELLVAVGIPPDRIQMAGRGKREPLVPSDEKSPEPRNRRVEIVVR
jgi:outer membrane protein OmpA-like peptidoglycan-associated protein